MVNETTQYTGLKKRDTLYYKNNSEGKTYISQLISKEDPYNICNITSMAMMLQYNGVLDIDGYEKDNSILFIDDVYRFINTNDDVIDYYYQVNPVLFKNWFYSYKKEQIKRRKDVYTPNEVHAVLSYGMNKYIFDKMPDKYVLVDKNKYVDKKICHFTENVDVTTIVEELLLGRTVVCSGVFNKLGHVVCVVGVELLRNYYIDEETKAILTPIELRDVKNFIIDDPYGDYHKSYTERKGNDINMKFDDFINIMKPRDSMRKWVHNTYIL